MTGPAPKHPIQPVIADKNGILRFKENAIVRWLLDKGSLNMNDIVSNGTFCREDREQFAQLIGYSLGGARNLPYVSDEVLAAAQEAHNTGESELEARNRHLRETLDRVRDGMRAGVAELYGVHPDDLKASDESGS